jgi:hypothetical protein
MARVVGETWKALSPAEKEPYEKARTILKGPEKGHMHPRLSTRVFPSLLRSAEQGWPGPAYFLARKFVHMGSHRQVHACKKVA